MYIGCKGKKIFFLLRRKLHKQQLCCSLRRRLGAKWNPLLLLESKGDDIDMARCWRLLQKGEWSPCISDIKCNQWLRCRGKEKERHQPPLGGRFRLGSWGHLEVGGLQSLGIYTLEVRRTQRKMGSSKLLELLRSWRQQMGWSGM